MMSSRRIAMTRTCRTDGIVDRVDVVVVIRGLCILDTHAYQTSKRKVTLHVMKGENCEKNMTFPIVTRPSSFILRSHQTRLRKTTLC